MRPEKIKIVLIEDEVLLRHSFVSVINQSSRYVVVGEYDNLNDAVKRINDLSDLIVLLDVNLFGEQTIDKINYLKRINPYNKVIMLSGDSSSHTIIQCLRNGADGYLVKEDAVLALGGFLDQAMKFDYVLSPTATNSMVYHVQSPQFNYARNEAVDQSFAADLTNAQKLVYRELIKGRSYQEIAAALDISKNTVGQHVQRIYKALGIHSKSELLSGNIKDS